MREVVIFGVGSPLAIDAEETCSRLGVMVVAAIHNTDGPTYVSDRLEILTALDIPKRLLDVEVVLPMFTPAQRKQALENSMTLGFSRYATLVDPTAAVASSTQIAHGVFINAGCTIGGATALHEFAFINRSASIGHHCAIERFASIGPGAILTGYVRVGEGSMIGAGAVLLPRIDIGRNAVVAAGSVVTASVAEGCVVMGSPARVVRES